jgi:hypothetical protein
MDPCAVVGAAIDTIAGGVADDIRADYLDCYDRDRFAESMRYVRRYPEELPELAELLVRSRSSTAATTASSRSPTRVSRRTAAQQPRRNHRCRPLRLGGGATEYASIVLDSLT